MHKTNESTAFRQGANCACQQSKITVKKKPIARFKCHCTICQTVYKKPYADFVVIQSKYVELNDVDSLAFSKFRLPPALKRGICTECHAPLIGFLSLAPFLKLAFIPAERFDDPNVLPDVQGHIFYHRRTQDIQDKLPKISGYWRSELAVSKAIIKGLA